MSKELIRLRDLCMAFDDELVLDHINLYINDSEFLTLLGPSGCGKTTTLRIIGGFTTPTSGDVTFDGVRINDVPPHKRQINTVFQKYALFPHLDVFENIAFGLRIAKVPADEIEQRVTEMLGVVSLKGFEHRRIHQLSGGQQQRVAIARALVNRPKVLLLDEPLGALDLRLRKDMQIELKRIQQQMGITFVYVTHDQEEALAISDRIAVMKEGNIMQVGTPEAIYKKPENTFVAGFIGVSNFVECEVDGKNPEAAVLNIKDECSITCKLKKPFSGKGIISARPEQLFFDESNGLPGKIVMSTFLGDFIEYEIELNNGQTLQLNEYTKDVQTVRPDGEQVKVNFDINAVGVYDAATQEVISW